MPRTICSAAESGFDQQTKSHFISTRSECETITEGTQNPLKDHHIKSSLLVLTCPITKAEQHVPPHQEKQKTKMF